MEQQPSQLPPFGNWENGDSVSYTAYFERARKGKGHAKRNPNGAERDFGTYTTSEPSTETSSTEKGLGRGLQKVAEPEAATPKHNHYRSGDEAGRRRLIGSPLHRGAIGEKTALGESRPYDSGVRKPKTEAEQVMKTQATRRTSQEYWIRAGEYDRPTQAARRTSQEFRIRAGEYDHPSQAARRTSQEFRIRAGEYDHPTQAARWTSHDYRIRAGEYGHPRRRFSESMLHRDPRYGGVASESLVHGGSGGSGMSSPNRSVWQNPRSGHIESSSLSAQHQASVGGGGGGGRMSSPAQEMDKRYSSTGRGHSAAPMTPGRSHLKPVARGDKTPNLSTAVPKFGDWDETNPSSADHYTHVFNRVVEEKNEDAGKAPVTTTETPHSNGRNLRADTRSKPRGCRCFPWRGR